MNESFVFKNKKGATCGYIMARGRQLRIRLPEGMEKACLTAVYEDGERNFEGGFDGYETERPNDGGRLIGAYVTSDGKMVLDTGNAAEGGADPLAELEKYPHRARTVHLKPYSKSAGFAPAVGEDDLPWEAMLESCEQRGATEWLIVEYEEEKDPVSAVQRSLSFLRKLRPRD